jgi:hypothetical protein
LQIPANFAISPLLPEILSWMSQVLQTTKFSLIRAMKAQTKPMTASGVDGFPFANVPALLLTPTSLIIILSGIVFRTESKQLLDSKYQCPTYSPNTSP